MSSACKVAMTLKGAMLVHRFQFLNFWKVPLQHQLLAANGATILDSTFLSWYTSPTFPTPSHPTSSKLTIAFWWRD